MMKLLAGMLETTIVVFFFDGCRRKSRALTYVCEADSHAMGMTDDLGQKISRVPSRPRHARPHPLASDEALGLRSPTAAHSAQRTDNPNVILENNVCEPQKIY